MLEELNKAVQQYKDSGLSFCEVSIAIGNFDMIDEIYKTYKVNSIMIENMIMDGKKNVRGIARINLDISDDKKVTMRSKKEV